MRLYSFESKLKGLDHLAIVVPFVFPGNVGGPTALADAVRTLSQKST